MSRQERREEMRILDQIVTRAPIEKGWSGDRKFCAVTKDGRKYLLLHAGITEFDPMVSLDEYMPEDFISTPLDPDAEYYENTTLVVGHTPTSELGSANKIFHAPNGNLFINCEDSLGCLCLETNEEFYV